MTDSGEYGPAMAVLTEKQRAFVAAAISNPTAPANELCKLAGYQNSENGQRVNGHRLMHDERILAAIEEEARKRVRLGGVIGIEGLIAIATNTHAEDADRLKACIALADRGGFGARTEHKVTVERVDDGRVLELAARFAAEFRLGNAKLIGGNVIEGKAKEIADDSPTRT